MFAPEDEDVMRLKGLEDATELRAQLNAEEWEALLEVHQRLKSTAMRAPRDDFEASVMARWHTREQQRTRWHQALGVGGFALGSALIMAMVLASLPLEIFLVPTTLFVFAQSVFTFLAYSSQLLQILFALNLTLAQWLGQEGLLVTALLALILSLFWSRLVTPPHAPATLNHGLINGGSL